MRINGENNAITRGERSAGGAEHRNSRVRGDTRPGDAVDISRRSAASTPGRGTPRAAEGGMDATVGKVHARLQERIRSGFYDTDEVLGSIASRVLDLFGL